MVNAARRINNKKLQRKETEAQAMSSSMVHTYPPMQMMSNQVSEPYGGPFMNYYPLYGSLSSLSSTSQTSTSFPYVTIPSAPDQVEANSPTPMSTSTTNSIVFAPQQQQQQTTFTVPLQTQYDLFTHQAMGTIQQPFGFY
jgi:hypothetical protein